VLAQEVKAAAEQTRRLEAEKEPVST
jgi:hypothetical protein